MPGERILNPLACNADQGFDTKVKCPTGQASFWVKFPTMGAKLQSNVWGMPRGEAEGMGGCGIDWYIRDTL